MNLAGETEVLGGNLPRRHFVHHNRLVIGFITILHVVTTVTFYTVTHLHSLQSVHSNISILFGASGIHLETADR
jgi:hypothetical protein